MVDPARCLVARDNLQAGQLDTGNLGPDARVMRNDCLAAAERVNRLRFGVGASHATARRVKAELHAALVDFAQGAYDCIEVAIDINSEDLTEVVALVRDGKIAWKAAGSHMRVATSYVR